MRLTLRNMLAYMDDILEAEDAELIRKKIEESKPATEQMHRIRDCMRRLRLGSPDLTERGGGLDPNTVAEYLDHQLANDRVADFEKVCLESDIHLAEVASCHQILALVLGEPAEVDPESRQRMYQLPELLAAQVKAATEAVKAEPAAEAVPAATEPSRRAKPAVPDYLRRGRESKGRFWARLAALAVVLVLLAGIAGLGYLGWTREKRAWERKPLAQGPTATASERPASKLQAGAKSPAAVAQADKLAPPATEATQTPAAPLAGPAGPAAPLAGPAGKAAAIAAKAETPAAPLAGPAGPAAAAGTKPAGTGGAADLVATPGGSGPGVAAAPLPPEAPPAPLPPPTKVPRPVAEAAPLPAPNVVAGGPNVAPLPPPIGGAAKKGGFPPVEPPAALVDRVGQLVSPREVLVKYSPETSSWVRVSKDTPLLAGDRFLSLPTYRPIISLGGEIRVQLVDNAMVVLPPVDPRQGLSGLTVDYGRMVVRPEGKTPARLHLQVGERSGVLTLVDGGSTLAIQAVRAANFKADPQQEPGPLVVDFFATSGKLIWQETHAAETVAMNAPARLTLSDQPAEPTAVERFPGWIAADDVSMLESRASTAMEPELKPNRSLALALQELAEHRLPEVRWLALRCLAAVGDFRLLVKALGNPEQKRSWPDYIDQLQAAIRRSPRSAAEVRTAMETLHGQEGAGLYELLWRYHAKGEKEQALPPADAERLVRCLEHKDLDFRVLAFWNLKNLTKVGLNYNYKPDDPQPKRQLAAQKWRDHFRQLAAGKPSEEAPVAPLPPDESPKPPERPAKE
jgi:hypothetical protein